jgi:predicted esterase
MAQARSRADELILWAGVFPPDLDLTVNKRIFQRMRVRIIVGDSDEFRDEDSLSKEVETFREHNIPYEFQEFKGKHEIEANALKALFEG